MEQTEGIQEVSRWKEGFGMMAIASVVWVWAFWLFILICNDMLTPVFWGALVVILILIGTILWSVGAYFVVVPEKIRVVYAQHPPTQ